MRFSGSSWSISKWCHCGTRIAEKSCTAAGTSGRLLAAKGSSRNRTHHLIKTFYASLGWRDEQHPDGTIILTTPTGHTYTTTPHGGALFPALAQSTGDLSPTPPIDPADIHRTAMMPRRRSTREQDCQARITQERRQSTELIAQQEREHQAWLAKNYEPPPF